MGSPKRAKQARAAEEFDLVRLAASLQPPAQRAPIFAWELDSIRAARQAQMSGAMSTAASLGQAVKTDGAIFSALLNRLAPQRSLPIDVTAANECATARVLRSEAEPLFGQRGIAVPKRVRMAIAECLALHGFAVAQNVWTPRCDGRRVDVELRPWPIEHVRFNRATNELEAITAGGATEVIRHGDGRWVVFQLTDAAPWGWGAIVPLALIWADRAYGIRDRSRASTSHGNAKVIGELPAGVPLDGAEAAAFLLLLRTMHEALPYGIRPAGAKTDMLVNTSTSWQVFDAIIKDGLGDAARVLLGHDGSVKAAGGNYIKDGFLFGISADIVEGDLSTIEDALQTGTIEIWAAMNFGRSEHAPRSEYRMPDADGETIVAALAARRKAFWEDLAAAKKADVLIDQKYVDDLAKDYRIRPPLLQPAPASAGAESVDYAYEQAADLASKMTDMGVDRCEHKRTNRCPLCGIERVRDVVVDDTTGEASATSVGWQPIGGFRSSSPSDPGSADQEAPEDRTPSVH